MDDRAYRRKLVEDHIGLARSVAAKTLRSLGLPGHLHEDVVSFANEGLAAAANRYDPSRGVAFSTFAYYRIRGAVFDGLRQMGAIRRRSRSKLAAQQGADLVLEQRLTAGESAGTLESAISELADTLADVAVTDVLSAGDRDVETLAGDGPGAEELAETAELSEVMRAALDRVPEKDRQILELLYFEGLSVTEAGRKLGVTRSWVSRMHAKAVERLRRSFSTAESLRSLEPDPMPG